MTQIPLTRKELANQYGISPATLSRRIRELSNDLNLKIESRKLLTPKQVKIIYEELGEPA